MKMSIICSDIGHPVNAYLDEWIKRHGQDHKIQLVREVSELYGGDILFLISCWQIVTAEIRSVYGVTLVLHASDLPRGRGWSPHIWELIAGATEVTVSLVEASEKVDSGRIWSKMKVDVPPTALWHEINHLIFMTEIQLMDFAVGAYCQIQPEEQLPSPETTYYRRRTPEDSRIDPLKTIAEQFDLIRVSDPIRYPSFFEHRGLKYKLKLEKLFDE